jgi:hypothetical protein
VGRRLSPLVAGIGLVGALAWFALGSSGRSAPAAPDTAPLAADLDARIRETLAGVQARADTLAQLPRLALAVATDERTVRDLTTDELAFRTKPGEHIEIAQVARKDGKDGAAHPLLRLPDDKLPLPMASLGPHVVIANGQLQVVVYVAVTPRDRTDELRGALAVAQTPDLSSFAPRFDALGLAGRIEVGGQATTLAGGEAASGTAAATMPLASAAPETVTLAFVGAPSPGATDGKRPLGGPLALLIVSLVAAAVLWRQGRQAPLATSSLRPAAAPLTPPVGTKPPPTLTPAVGAKPPTLTPAVGTKPPTPTPALGAKPVPAFGPGPGVKPAALTPPVGVAAAAKPAPALTPAVGLAAAARPAPAFTPAAGLPAPPPAPRPIVAPLSAPLPIVVAPADSDGTPSAELLGDEDSTGATADPSPLSGPVKLPQSSPRLARPRLPNEPSRATATLPSYLFEVAAGSERPTTPNRGTPTSEDALGRELRALYVEYIKMRRTCRQSVDNLDADRFVATLRKQHEELSQKHGNREIRFRIAFDNGKAAIRFSVG